MDGFSPTARTRFFKSLECSRRYPSTTASSGIAIEMHLQKFWIVSMDSNVMKEMQLSRICSSFGLFGFIERFDGPGTALKRKDAAKLALEVPFWATC